MMRQRIHNIIEWFECPPLEQEKAKHHQFQFQKFYVILSFLAFFSSFFFSFLYLYLNLKFNAAMNIVACSLIIASLFFYRFTRHYSFSVFFLITLLQLLIALQLITLDSRQASILIWSSVITIGSVVINGGRYALASLLTNITIITTAIVICPLQLLPQASFTDDQRLIFDIAGITSSLAVALLLGLTTLIYHHEMVCSIEEQKKKFLDSFESTSALLSILTHDIANPLAVIVGLLDQINMQRSILSSQPQNESSIAHTNTIVDKITLHAQKISSIISAVRTLKANSDHKISIKLSAVNLVKKIEASLVELAPHIQKKQIEITKIYDETQTHPIYIQADPTSLQFNVINHLIANAIKYSDPKSKITISVIPSQNEVIFKVKDEGIGIPEKLIPTLFISTKNTIRPGTDGTKGTGFSLPLVKMFADRYLAKIEVLSTEKTEYSNQHGTVFSLFFKKWTEDVQ